MWEKIVLNLLSNAFKFTFEGGIARRAARTGRRPSCSGPRHRHRASRRDASAALFERFHRVEGAARRAPTRASGIGLALVQELVPPARRGDVGVESAVGPGTDVHGLDPARAAHLPGTGCGPAADPPRRTSTGAEDFVAMRPAPARRPTARTRRRSSARPRDRRAADRSLVADDNADMRRLPDAAPRRGTGTVEPVADGPAALEAALRSPPDLVLTDVMMPRLDGFGAAGARAVRRRPPAAMPVILLSARAGEEARIEGLAAGRRRLPGQALQRARAGGAGAPASRLARARREARGRGRPPRRPTGPRTSSWPCWATSCATRWRRSSPRSQLMRLRGASAARARAGDHRAAGRATWSGWSTTCSTSRASPGARSSCERERVELRRRSWPRRVEMASPLLEQRAAPARRRRAGRGLVVDGDPDAPGAGGRQPAHQRREVHRAGRPASR